MKHAFLFLILLSSGLGQAQDSTSVETFSSILKPGEELGFGEKTIKFKETVSDSRCPRNVTCIWPGEAKVLVEIFENGMYCGEEILVVSARGEAAASLNDLFPGEGFFISGLVLNPYPKASEKIKPSEYTLALEVKQNL